MAEEQLEPDSLWEKFQALPGSDQLAVVLSVIPAAGLLLVFIQWPVGLWIPVLGAIVPVSVLLVSLGRKTYATALVPGGTRPTLIFALIFPVGGLAAIAVHYEVIGESKFNLPAIAGGVVLALISGLPDPEVRKRPWILLVLVLFLSSYLRMLATDVNCYYDQSAPQIIAARVKSKYRDSSGKQMSTYKLELEPWGPQTRRSFVEVGPGTYRRAEEGQQVEVKLRAGRLGLPWYYLDEP